MYVTESLAAQQKLTLQINYPSINIFWMAKIKTPHELL